MGKLVELVLTCNSWQEAEKISNVLLQKKLVACVESFEVNSQYWWEGQLESAKEVKLVMHSASYLFDQVELEVKKLHSYDTFVLQALPVEHVSADAKKWLEETLGADNAG